MTSGFLSEVSQTATRIGAEPKWLKEGREPQFTVTEKDPAACNPLEPDMILLHGLFGAMSNWEGVFPLFSEYSNPMALSFPLLTAHRSEVQVKALAVYTEYFIRSRNLQPVTLCGNSMGGHVALRLCLALPELVDCLILSGTSGLYEHSVDSLPIRPDKAFVREHMGRVFKNPKFITDESIDEIHAILSSKANTLNLIYAARSAKKDNLQDVLKDIKVPTLLLWGEEDEVTTPDIAEMFHRYIPNSELKFVAGCGHAPMIERPDWFSEQVHKFLKEHSRFYKRP